MKDPGARRLTSERPGATRSTPRALLPRLLNSATVSSPVVKVPCGSLAPTAMTKGSRAGLVSDGAVAPWLPADTTTTMPCRQATSAA